MGQQVATYYRVLWFEMGGPSGSRSANYHYYLTILDAAGQEILKHPLSDVFAGKWRKCAGVIKKWDQLMKKHKLTELYDKPLKQLK